MHEAALRRSEDPQLTHVNEEKSCLDNSELIDYLVVKFTD